MSHLTSSIPLKIEGPISDALSFCTQMDPNKNAFLQEDPIHAQTIRVITLQTSLFCHSKGKAYKTTAMLKEP